MADQHAGKLRLALIYLWLSLRLFLLRLVKISSGLIIGVLILGLVVLLLQTLLGQGVIWLKTHDWLPMPTLYWFVYPWGSIVEDISLYRAKEFLNPFVNPFITLGVLDLTLDPKTLLPQEGTYWATYTWFGGFTDWLNNPRQWLGLHTAVMYLLKCPISLFLALLALILSQSSKHFFDNLQRDIFHLQVLREKHAVWLKELLQASKARPQ